jgi:hypothetical protein
MGVNSSGWLCGIRSGLSTSKAGCQEVSIWAETQAVEKIVDLEGHGWLIDL